MTDTKPSIINEPSVTAAARCQHRTLNGRCRQLATDPAGSLCFDHARSAKQVHNDFTLLAPLVRKPEDFLSADSVNETLGALHNLLAEGRISPRRAAVIAYVDSLILRTIPAMAREEGPPQIICDMPGPNRPYTDFESPTPDSSQDRPLTYQDVRT